MNDFTKEVEDVFESVGMDELLMFFAILFGIMIVAVIFATVAKKSKDAANAACPVERMHARVVDKQQTPAPTNGIVVYSRIWILFELDDGRRIRLLISGNNSAVIGDSGELVWQGDALISFRRDEMGKPVSPNRHAAPTFYQQNTSFGQTSIPTWKRIEMEEAEKSRRSDAE